MGVSRTWKAALSAAALLAAGCGPQPVRSPAGQSPQATAPPLTQSAPGGAQPPAFAPSQNQKHQQLIEQAEKTYASGMSNYRAGRLSAAKADFDRAVDLLLTSGVDVKSDPQLNDEFEHLVDAINALEMEALKQGNGFAPKVEPSPVDIANDITFPVDPNLRAQAEAELKTTVSDLPLVINDAVASQISFFSTKGHGTLQRSLERSGRYRAMIQKILAEEGVPQDLIYQAVAESGFQPQALNGRSGAGGMWQFMPFSGYGLSRNGWVDERFDPEKSSRAYARYIKSLYNQFGDWYLAMAAYDWGPGGVQRAVQRTGYADFWELYRRNALPQETKNYIPIILAATIMAKNPSKYGLDGLTPNPPLITDTVKTSTSIDLRLVADVVEAPLQEILSLNPSLLRMSTPPDASFDLHLPPGTAELFEKRIAEIPEDKRRYWRFHKLKPADTLEQIARDYHVSATDIAFVNQLPPGNDLSQSEALVIPVAPTAAPASVRSATYTVRRGDTLVTVADRFGASVDQLRRWNHLKSAHVATGRRLFVSEPARVVRVSRRHRTSRGSSHRATTSSRAARAHSSSSSRGSSHHASTHPAKKSGTSRHASK